MTALLILYIATGIVMGLSYYWQNASSWDRRSTIFEAMGLAIIWFWAIVRGAIQDWRNYRGIR